MEKSEESINRPLNPKYVNDEDSDEDSDEDDDDDDDDDENDDDNDSNDDDKKRRKKSSMRKKRFRMVYRKRNAQNRFKKFRANF